MRKGFDTVDHALLLSKLSVYGIKNTKTAWSNSYLFDRKQFVVFDGKRSGMQAIFCGVSLGSILGPLMFILLLSDIESNLKVCNIVLYADDTVLFYTGKTSTEMGNILSSELQEISHWLNESYLVINLKKSKTECVL